MQLDLTPFREAAAQIETQFEQARATLASLRETALAAQRSFADVLSTIPQTWRLPNAR